LIPQNNTRNPDAIRSGTLRPAAAAISALLGRDGLTSEAVATISAEAGVL
jgi:hypothetical protein